MRRQTPSTPPSPLSLRVVVCRLLSRDVSRILAPKVQIFPVPHVATWVAPRK
jgi:hypothetical protein